MPHKFVFPVYILGAHVLHGSYYSANVRGSAAPAASRPYPVTQKYDIEMFPVCKCNDVNELARKIIFSLIA